MRQIFQGISQKTGRLSENSIGKSERSAPGRAQNAERSNFPAFTRQNTLIV